MRFGVTLGLAVSLVAVACGHGSDASPLEWTLSLDGPGPGVHTVAMLVDFGPVAAGDVADTSGRLVWDEIEVDLCGIEVRSDPDDDSLVVGDVFHTTDGCGGDPMALQKAFDSFGIPAEACVAVRVGDADHGFCDPLVVEGADWTPTEVVIRTATVAYGELSVRVFNGNPVLHDFLLWGLQRYESAGLPLPRVTSVTFLYDPEVCRGAGGLAARTESGTDITFCSRPGEVCEDEDCTRWHRRYRHLWLHELAHAWLDDNVDDPTRQRFLELVEMERWSDHDDPWTRRGVERAANTIAYGLIDEPVTLAFSFQGTCEQRDQGFRLLTGIDPVAPCTDDDLGESG